MSTILTWPEAVAFITGLNNHRAKLRKENGDAYDLLKRVERGDRTPDMLERITLLSEAPDPSEPPALQSDPTGQAEVPEAQSQTSADPSDSQTS